MEIVPPLPTRRAFLAGGATLAASALLRAPRAPAAVADLDFGSALAAARAIHRGEVSSVELTTRMLDRIRQHNLRLNAVVTLTEDAAQARAKAADEAGARGASDLVFEALLPGTLRPENFRP